MFEHQSKTQAEHKKRLDFENSLQKYSYYIFLVSEEVLLEINDSDDS